MEIKLHVSIVREDANDGRSIARYVNFREIFSIKFRISYTNITILLSRIDVVISRITSELIQVQETGTTARN